MQKCRTYWLAGMLVVGSYAQGLAQSVQEFIGKASYYARKFDGRATANGETFSQEALTAAHLQLPFNSLVEVTNLANNKSVLVRINDRGPYVRSRIIDLSRAAARLLDMVEGGMAQVKLKVLSWGDAQKAAPKAVPLPADLRNYQPRKFAYLRADSLSVRLAADTLRRR
jgi:rare lipoprotein A